MHDVVSTVRGRMPLRLALGPRARAAGRADVVEDRRAQRRPQAAAGARAARPDGARPLRPRRDHRRHVAHPRVDGVGAHPRGHRARPAGREEVLEAVYADLHFDESAHHARLAVARGRAAPGACGRSGAVELSGFDLRNYRFELHDARLRVAARRGSTRRCSTATSRSPTVRASRASGCRRSPGDVQLKRGVIEFDFANQSEVQSALATTEPLYWTYRVHVERAEQPALAAARRRHRVRRRPRPRADARLAPHLRRDAPGPRPLLLPQQPLHADAGGPDVRQPAGGGPGHVHLGVHAPAAEPQGPLQRAMGRAASP